MDSILTKQSRRTQKSFNMLIRQGNDILIYKPYAINLNLIVAKNILSLKKKQVLFLFKP